MWRHAVQLGWPGVVVPEASGGSGGTLLDAGVIAYEMGRGALFSGYPESVALVCHAPATAAALPPHASVLLGDVVAGTAELRALGSIAGVPGWGHAASGLLIPGEAARTVLVLAPDRGSSTLAALGLEHAAAEAIRGTARAGELLVSVDDTAQRQAVPLLEGAAAEAAWRWAGHAVRGLRCAELSGAVRALLESRGRLRPGRVQVGHPIGSYQAVQHALTDMLAAADAAEMLTLQALAADADAPTAAARVDAALAFVRETAWRTVMSGYDILGAVGFMEVHPINFYTRGVVHLLAGIGSAEDCDMAAGAGVATGHWLS